MTSTPLVLAAPEELGLSTSRLARLGAALRGEIERGRLPGAVALVGRRGRIGYLESFGRQDPSANLPMTTDSIFRIYSMTKPITSVAAMMLCEQGRFVLNDPIGKYLPELSDLRSRWKAAERSSCCRPKAPSPFGISCATPRE